MQTILFAEPTSPALEGANGAKKVELPEFRPVHFGKIQLASGALPKEETRKADFATRADDEIEIGQIGSVKPFVDRSGAQFVEDRVESCLRRRWLRMRLRTASMISSRPP